MGIVLGLKKGFNITKQLLDHESGPDRPKNIKITKNFTFCADVYHKVDPQPQISGLNKWP